jgi:crotonobetainyl-CoA:carnitine CoA-transferase CaiB-like acyl-CoA transferase
VARARHDEVDGALTAWAAGRTREDGVAALRAARVPAGPVNDARDLFFDPHMQERGLYEWVRHAPGTGIGTRPIIGRAFKLSDTELRVPRPAPPLGEANEYAYKELLGLNAFEFQDLVDRKITGIREPLEEPQAGLPIDALLGVRRIRVYDPDYKERLGIVVDPD